MILLNDDTISMKDKLKVIDECSDIFNSSAMYICMVYVTDMKKKK